MAKKKKKRRPADQYQLPPKQAAAAGVAEWEPRPALPQRRLILGSIGMSLLCVAITLGLWLPARFLVQDLRSQGVSVAATIVEVDSNPKYVKVRLIQGPKSGTVVKLSDYAGMYPDAHVGEPMVVTYDPRDPTRSLARGWVDDPPANVPAYGAGALSCFFLVAFLTMTLHRLWNLRKHGPPTTSGSPPTAPKKPNPKGIRLTKP